MLQLLALNAANVGQPSQGGAPSWHGDRDLDGSTILVECPGRAFGDTIQFARAARLAKRRGARVILQCHPGLDSLMRTLPGVDDVVAPYDECEAYDYQCRADVVGFLMQWDFDSMLPEAPYLFADTAARARWSARVDRRGVRVGIVWRAQGLSVTSSLSPHKQPQNAYAFRSAPLSAFRPLAELPDTSLFSLQVGAGREEVTPATRAWLTDLGGECVGFTNAAAAVSALDAVVTIDSAMAHLAGAVGTPCLLMVPYYAEFRWMTDSAEFRQGQASAWYPSLRVFRQKQPGDWAGVMAEVADAVRALASRGDRAAAGG
jgi:hypothetical protein